jgi:dTDP-3-amino-3,4,6-trideoxy-alpha-D-glucose transaminase
VTVPLFATAGALGALRGELADRLGHVLDSGRYILGDESIRFESEFARFLGARHCVGMNSGTDALTIGLRALGVAPGDEVIVPTVSFAATAEAVIHADARPVFADVEELTWTVSARTVEPLINERTSAIVPVHLFGNPAPMTELCELAASNGLRLLEDAAQSAGARLHGQMTGTFADAAAFSFYPSKNLPAIGDAGALITDDPEVAAKARRLREHGQENRGSIHTEVGYNSRLDELQAAALCVALPHLQAWTIARRDVAALYAERGLGPLVELPAETPGAESCFYLYAIAAADRARLIESLKGARVGHRIYFTPTLIEQPAFAEFRSADPRPGAERYSREALAIPMGPDLTPDDVDVVTAAVRTGRA